MANIRDIAARANVSIATVSHVLNGTRAVRPETRAAVNRAVSELGYAVDASARTLARGRADLFGLVVSDIRNPFFPDIAAAFQAQASESGFDTVFMNTWHDAKRALASVERLLALKVSGIGVLTSQVSPALRQLLQDRSVPAAYLDLGTPGPYMANISIDYESGIRQVVESLLELGHRRIAYLSGPRNWHSAKLRLQAFQAATRSKAEVETRDAGGSGVQEGYVAASRMITAFRPTAIACFNDQLAIGALHAAHDRGYSLPAELSVTGFDDISFAENAYPPLTTVSVPKEELGRLAAAALVGMLATDSHIGSQQKLAVSLVVRSSTAAPYGGQGRQSKAGGSKHPPQSKRRTS